MDKVVVDTSYAVNSPSYMDTLTMMREAGAKVMLNESMPQDMFESLLPHADILQISLTGRSPRDVIKIRSKFKGFGGEMMASGVGGWDAYEGTMALGFNLFQGSFYTHAQVTDDKGPAPSAVAKLQLLRELSADDIDMEELSQVIASDISLSYRLLRYINSAAFGFPSKIKSVQQAVALLGLNEVRHWATVVAMTDMDASPKGEELAFMALQRARFLGKMADTMAGIAYSAESMFLLGLFSKLDALLSFDMADALEGIPLDMEMHDALCGEANSMHDWLEMLAAVEEARWQDANAVLNKYGACFTETATLYLKASTWAAQQLPSMKQ